MNRWLKCYHSHALWVIAGLYTMPTQRVNCTEFTGPRPSTQMVLNTGVVMVPGTVMMDLLLYTPMDHAIGIRMGIGIDQMALLLYTPMGENSGI